MQTNKKVDFHSHFLSKTYYEYLEKYEGPEPDSFPTPKWDIESHITQMDSLGIAFSFISISSPNLSGADCKTEVEMVHKINIEGKEYVDAYPNRLGLFASLPLPHVEEAIEEAKFALDEIKADGFGLSTHYAGTYLGDPKYDELMEFLNSRKAVIAIHPVQPAALPKGINRIVPIPAMEFFMDTTRTFLYMVTNNIFERYPDIRWIFPHAGAFLSILSDRMGGFSIVMKQKQPHLPIDFKNDMRHVYFDVAGFCLQKQLASLLKDVTADNLLYGSDVPYTPHLACVALSGGLENFKKMNDEDSKKMFYGNAISLIPRLQDIIGETGSTTTVCYSDKALTTKEKTSRYIRKTVAKMYGKVFK